MCSDSNDWPECEKPSNLIGPLATDIMKNKYSNFIDPLTLLLIFQGSSSAANGPKSRIHFFYTVYIKKISDGGSYIEIHPIIQRGGLRRRFIGFSKDFPGKSFACLNIYCFHRQETVGASWPWLSCATNSKTLSFRADAINGDIIHKTINPHNKISTKNGFSHHNIQYDHDDIEPETCIKRPSSERFFFKPGKSNSILEEAKTQYSFVTTLEIIESMDPISDFRVSMEEMVEAHGMRDWESLERLLACYLRVNGKNNHGYIIGAFVDLLFPDQASCSGGIDENCSSSSFTSPLSFSSSSTYSSAGAFNLSNSLENKDEMVVDDTC